MQATTKLDHAIPVNSHKDLRAWPVAEVLADRKKCLSWAMCFHFGFLNLVTVARHGVYGTILTGNTILAASSGSKLDFVSVGFYVFVILFYLSGQALYWIIDIKLYNRTSAGVLAPLVFVLYALTDVLDYIATDGSFSRANAAVLKANRWNLLPVAVGAGCISACGAHIDAVITNMITGHYNIIVSAYVTYYASGRRGLPDARKKACLVSIGCVASFSSGACLSAALSIHVGTDWQLCGLGLFAAVLLKLHDYVHKHTFDKLKDKRVLESASSQGDFDDSLTVHIEAKGGSLHGSTDTSSQSSGDMPRNSIEVAKGGQEVSCLGHGVPTPIVIELDPSYSKLAAQSAVRPSSRPRGRRSTHDWACGRVRVEAAVCVSNSSVPMQRSNPLCADEI